MDLAKIARKPFEPLVQRLVLWLLNRYMKRQGIKAKLVKASKPTSSCKPQPKYPSVGSTAEFITACLLNNLADLPMSPSDQAEARKTANGLAVSIYRKIYSQRHVGPSAKMSDALILDIYRQVGCAFRKVGDERREFVESAVINVIVLEFLEAYRRAGPDFFKEHLQYELETYKREGLRADYVEKRMDLFGSAA
jgi:hypothetical protein